MMLKMSLFVSGVPDLELVGDRSKEHDWMRISAFTFNNQLSPVSCRLMWQNLLHVSINRSKWSGDETKDLTRLVKEEAHNYRSVQRRGRKSTNHQCISDQTR